MNFKQSRKGWLAVCCGLVLSGCATISADFSTQVASDVEDGLKTLAMSPSFNKKYYSYYTEPRIGRIQSTATSNTFSYEGNLFVMNLDVPKIINDAYYPDEAPTTLSIQNGIVEASQEGTYIDYLGAEYPYSLTIYSVGKTYFVILQSQFMQFCGTCGRLDAPGMAQTMLEISRSIKIHGDRVIAAFSTKQTLNYTREEVQLFQYVAPESGNVEELFIDPSGNSIGYENNGGQIESDERDGDINYSEELDPPEENEEPTPETSPES